MKKRKTMLPLNLQLFADDDPSDLGGNPNDNPDNPNNDDKGKNVNIGEKTFTQKDVSAMMAREKNEGRRAQLKSLGFANEQEAIDALKELENFRKSKKTKEENLENDVKNLSGDKEKAIKRAEAAEQKLSCFTIGVNENCIDDVLAIAITKVTDDKSLDDVLKEMKGDQKYFSFFNSNSKGTGRNPGHNNQDNGSHSDYGKMLAERNSSKKVEKSYFS